MVAAKLVGIINQEGGRFLKQKKGDEGEWYELSTQEAKAKVSHAIRDAIAAKDKTKANKAGMMMGPFGKFMDFNLKQAHMQFGKMGDQMHMGGNPLGMGQIPTQPSQNLSLTSMAQPLFNMGGQQRFGRGPNSVQDQIQQMQAQALVQSNTQPFMGNMGGMGGALGTMGLGGGMGMAGGMGGMGTGGMPQQMMQQRRHSQPASMQSMLSPEMAPSMQIGMGRNSLPGGLRPSLQDRLNNVTVARAPLRQAEESKVGRNGSSDTEDGGGDTDTEFLSLIDTVLGPAPSPRKRDRRT